MLYERKSDDIHSILPRRVSKFHRELWARLDGIEFNPEYHYRLLRDRRYSEDNNRWLLAESKDWSPQHLRLIKEHILDAGETYGFSITGKLTDPEYDIEVTLYPQRVLKLGPIGEMRRAGFYVGFTTIKAFLDYGLRSPRTDVAILIPPQQRTF